MRVLYTLIAVTLVGSTMSQQPAWDWASNVPVWEGEGYFKSKLLRTKVDRFGNCFILKVRYLVPAVVPTLYKFSKNGKLLWTRNFVGSMNDIAVDAAGNIFLGGNDSLAGHKALVIMKLNDQGAEVWRKYFLTQHGDVTALLTAASGDIYFTGYYFGKVNFDGNMIADRHSLYLVKLNGSGAVKWALSGTDIGGDPDSIMRHVTGLGLVMDASQQSVFLSYYSNLNCYYCSSISHLARVGRDGDVLLNKQVPFLGDMLIDKNSNIYSFTGDSWTSWGYVDVTKFNRALEEKWKLRVAEWQGASPNLTTRLSFDADENIFIGGATSDFDHGAGQVVVGLDTFIEKGRFDILLSLIDKNTGEFKKSWQIAGKMLEWICDVTTDVFGNCYVTGFYNSGYDNMSYQDTLCFDNNCIMSPDLKSHIFAAKLKVSNKEFNDNVDFGEVPYEKSIRMFPNPTSGNIQVIAHENKVSVEIRTMDGAILCKKLLSPGEEIDVHDLLPGSYFVCVRSADNTHFLKLIKQ